MLMIIKGAFLLSLREVRLAQEAFTAVSQMVGLWDDGDCFKILIKALNSLIIKADLTDFLGF